MRAMCSVCLVWIFLSAMMQGMPITRATYAESLGTIKDPIIDSAITVEEALDGSDRRCPDAIRKRLKITTVIYYSFDKKIHKGQLVIDRTLEKDVQSVFDVALKVHFPIHSVIPLSDVRFRKGNFWDDNLSMRADNTSAFNCRSITGGKGLSTHAYGRAIDINPVQNPYLNGGITLPQGAKYDPNSEGALTAYHPIVRAFQQLGWRWGGDWKTLKDYQHFEKLALPPER
jgi:peptidoglycan L-alanyl-D-glutamate endopeptidase CwlK